MYTPLLFYIWSSKIANDDGNPKEFEEYYKIHITQVLKVLAATDWKVRAILTGYYQCENKNYSYEILFQNNLHDVLNKWNA